MTPASAEDWRELARRRLPPVLFDYVDGGAYAELTLRRNAEDLAALALRQRVMRDVSRLKLETELFGERLAMPVILGPVGLAGMYARRGEVQAARAAKAAGVPFTLSTVGVCTADEVTAGAGGPPWFQLYMIRDRGYMRDLLQRAREAGCRTLVFTVDLPTPGTRYRDVRSGMFGRLTAAGRARQAWQGLTRPGWLWDVHLRGRPHTFGSIAPAVPDAQGVAAFWVWVKANFDPGVTWADIEWVRGLWDGPIVIKGVLDVEDARLARDAGADGLVVSNHGGRQLDGVRSGAAALPAIAEAVGAELTVLMDGGIRSGLDVLKALALGARAALLGRAWAFPLAAAGEAGVARMLGTMRDELATAMMLTGCVDVGAAGPHLLDRG